MVESGVFPMSSSTSGRSARRDRRRHSVSRQSERLFRLVRDAVLGLAASSAVAGHWRCVIILSQTVYIPLVPSRRLRQRCQQSQCLAPWRSDPRLPWRCRTGAGRRGIASRGRRTSALRATPWWWKLSWRNTGRSLLHNQPRSEQNGRVRIGRQCCMPWEVASDPKLSGHSRSFPRH